jgi:predicted transglutaminase-like cysteine proteinase
MIEHQLRTHIGLDKRTGLQGPLNQDRFVTSSGLVEVRSSGNCMRRIGNSSALRAILLACGLSLICLPTDLMAAQLNLPGSVDRADSSSEPFGLSTAMVTTGAVLEKWLSVERDVDDERLVLRMCEENRASCQSQAALQFLAIVDRGRRLEGRARLGEINRAINLKLKLTSDLALYGAEDVWSPPLATLAIGGGDCEDYAIAKFVALQEAGVSPDDLRIVILRDDLRDEDHAVVAARLDGHWLTLDNRHMVLVEDHDVRRYRPIFLLDRDGVKAYSDAPSTFEASRGYERAIGQIRR